MQKVRAGTSGHPEQDWFVLLTVAALFLAASFAWHAWIWDTILGGNSISFASEQSASSVGQPSLDTVHAVFSARAMQSAKYTNGGYSFIDPTQ